MQENAVQIYEPLSDFYRTDIRHQYEKGAAPGMTVEPELSQELADGAKAFADVAVVVISRFSGEGWDRSSIECNNEFNPWDTETTMPKISGEVFPDGDFYLTTREKAMLSMVKERFDDIVAYINIFCIVYIIKRLMEVSSGWIIIYVCSKSVSQLTGWIPFAGEKLRHGKPAFHATLPSKKSGGNPVIIFYPGKVHDSADILKPFQEHRKK